MEIANPINILMNNIIIGTVGGVAVSSWTFYSLTFTIPTSGIVIVKLEGVQSTTTAVDNIIVV